ncbi:MAG: twin-arginine translocase TatA/TatE family subunit [Deltaproteobacteria bacterium]|nr:twin-arginine translocase TatA/TatE family subunit [Deltaproteobacteria bacterium]
MLGITELILIFIVALIFLGPDKLPELAKTLAKGILEFKKTVNNFKDNLDIDEDLKNDIKEVKQALTQPMATIGAGLAGAASLDAMNKTYGLTPAVPLSTENQEGRGNSELPPVNWDRVDQAYPVTDSAWPGIDQLSPSLSPEELSYATLKGENAAGSQTQTLSPRFYRRPKSARGLVGLQGLKIGKVHGRRR